MSLPDRILQPMRSTVILTVLLVTVLLAGLVPKALAASSYEREVVLDGRLALKSDELMRLVELARVNVQKKDKWRESLRLIAGDANFSLGEGFTLEDITRVGAGASHGSGRYELMGSSIYIELVWHEYQTRLSVGAKDRDQMEMMSAVLEQKIRAAFERSLRDQPTASVPVAMPAQPSVPVAMPAQPSVHRREFELPPLTFTYNDMLRLVEQIETQLPPGKLGEAALTIRSGDEEVKIPGPLTEKALARLPRRSTSLSYDFRASNMPISRVSISLSDYSRRVDVEGTDEGRVNGLASMVRRELEEHTALVGGPARRFVLAAVVLVLGFVLVPLVAINPRIKTLWKWWAVTVPMVGIVLMFLGPWDEWLPGTEIDAHDASFFNRMGSWWSLFGLLIAVPPFVAWLHSCVTRVPVPAAPTEPAAAEPVPTAVEAAGTAPAVRSHVSVLVPDSVEITPGNEHHSGEVPEEMLRNEPLDDKGPGAGSPP
jgi:hypothetical protein